MGAQDQLDLALETDLTAKHAAMKKFETWEKEHSDALKRVNSKIQELKHDKESFRSSASGCTGLSQKRCQAKRLHTVRQCETERPKQQ